MKKFLLVPDSFKGTMDSKEICGIMARKIQRHFPEAEIICIPVADGGEGNVDAFLSVCNGEKKRLTVKGPFFADVPAFYGLLPNNTAVFEMAACAGLPLAAERLNPELTTTYGVGQLMLDAIKNGCTRLIVGLGGSATNDGGCGMAAALGARFTDENGNLFVPTGGTLSKIRHIDISHMAPELKQTEIITMCDINNPLTGPTGAAYVFAPQKGADFDMVKRLDAGLQHLAEVIKKEQHIDCAHIPGSGAAGGMGYGMQVFLSSSLKMGIDTILDVSNFDQHLQDADFVFTGEGRIDEQSLYGKVVCGVAKRTSKAGIPLIAVVGDIGDNIDRIYNLGVSAIFSINRIAADYPCIRLRARNDLALTMDNLMRFIKEISYTRHTLPQNIRH